MEVPADGSSEAPMQATIRPMRESRTANVPAPDGEPRSPFEGAPLLETTFEGGTHRGRVTVAMAPIPHAEAAGLLRGLLRLFRRAAVAHHHVRAGLGQQTCHGPAQAPASRDPGRTAAQTGEVFFEQCHNSCFTAASSAAISVSPTKDFTSRPWRS